MRRGVKVVIWAGVLAACAGTGAFVAAHTNPFPPGVEDPGARPTPPPPTSTAPTSERWNLLMNSATRHDLHVGGACRSGWRTTGVVTIRPDGVASGHALARLEGWRCDFGVAQVQTRTVGLTVSGRSAGDTLNLRFSETDLVGPPGSQDLGGFVATLPVVNGRMRLVGGHADVRISVSRPDGDLGHYVNDSAIRLDCVAAC